MTLLFLPPPPCLCFADTNIVVYTMVIDGGLTSLSVPAHTHVTQPVIGRTSSKNLLIVNKLKAIFRHHKLCLHHVIAKSNYCALKYRFRWSFKTFCCYNFFILFLYSKSFFMSCDRHSAIQRSVGTDSYISRVLETPPSELPLKTGKSLSDLWTASKVLSKLNTVTLYINGN